MQQAIKTYLMPKWLIPVEPHGVVWENKAIAIDAEGKIADLLPAHIARKAAKGSGGICVELPQHVLFPGLVNAHTHSPMTLLRGLADDRELMDWLQNYIWPAEQQYVSPSFIKDGTQLAIAEMLRCGTTCFNEHYFYPELIAQVASEAGIRASIGIVVLNVPTPWAKSTEEYISKGLQDLSALRKYPLVQATLAPHAPYTVDDAAFKKIRSLSEQYGLGIHLHTHETEEEVRNSIEQYGKRPLQRLADLGILGPGFQAVHMTAVDDQDIDLIKQSRAHVITCPESNLKLASGFCPVKQFLDAGVNVGLGTDGAASNNDLDMLSEMRTMALLAKAVGQDPTAVDAATALRIATLNGARALGLETMIGSIEVGKYADVAAVDLSALNTQPCYHPLSHLVYAAHSTQVTDVWVAGKHLLSGGKLTTLEQSRLSQKAGFWADKIRSLRPGSSVG